MWKDNRDCDGSYFRVKYEKPHQFNETQTLSFEDITVSGSAWYSITIFISYTCCYNVPPHLGVAKFPMTFSKSRTHFTAIFRPRKIMKTRFYVYILFMLVVINYHVLYYHGIFEIQYCFLSRCIVFTLDWYMSLLAISLPHRTSVNKVKMFWTSLTTSHGLSVNHYLHTHPWYTTKQKMR